MDVCIDCLEREDPQPEAGRFKTLDGRRVCEFDAIEGAYLFESECPDCGDNLEVKFEDRGRQCGRCVEIDIRDEMRESRMQR